MPYCFAEQIGKTENVTKNGEHRGSDAILSNTGTLPNKQLTSTEQLNLKQQLEQGLGELRQTLLKHQKSIDLQKRQLANQTKVIVIQKRMLEKQDEVLQYLRDQSLSQDQLNTQRAAGTQDPETAEHRVPEYETERTPSVSQSADEQPYQAADNANPAEKTNGTSGVNKSQIVERPKVVAIPDIGGVLTPRGKLMLEPAIQASHSSLNQFTFLGVEIVEAFLVGLIQAEDTNRNLISPQLTARYGITHRLEVELKIAYVYRSDKVSGTIPQIQDTDNVAATVDRDFDGQGLGDIELAFHYQLNNGLNGWPFFVGNLRWKSRTGEGPFDVDRDVLGKDTESPTGSGFHALEPSLTILYPSDPVVLFANIGYLINFDENLNKTFIQTIEADDSVEAQTFGNVDPGDSFRLSFGMGYSLNERASFTLGYKHDFIQKTEFEINGAKIFTNDLDVGSLLLGWGFEITPDVSVNLNLELGITQDAPDVLVTLRVPFAAYNF